jgi:hypothetical protein
LAALALAVCPSPSAAQAHPGIRGGASLAPARRIPDVTVQVYAGAHVETEPLVKRLVFRPNLEAGFGDGLVVIAVNGEFAWRFQPGALGWAPYVGAGPTLNVFSFGGDRLDGRGTETSTGMSFLAGFEHRTGVFVEFKLCSINRRDIMEPLISGLEELKVGVGYTWR